MNVTQTIVFHWDTVHAQTDTSEPLLILTLAAQLNDASHVNTLPQLQLPELIHQSLTSTQQLQLQNSRHAHQSSHVMIAKEMNEFTETAGHQRLAHTANVTLMEKFDVLRPNALS